MLLQALPLALLATAAQATDIYSRSESTNSTSLYIRPALVPVAPAVYDGECFFPTPDQQFRLSTYTGRWYQLAGTRVSFTERCECTFAEYALNTTGVVSVFNSCQVPTGPGAKPIKIEIRGTATPVSPSYGLDGVFQVKFPGQPQGGDCKKGPNYIVQSYDEVNGWAIVQTGNFTTMFLLSRKQDRSEAEISGWLIRAGRLGTDLSKVIRTKQSNCVHT